MDTRKQKYHVASSTPEAGTKRPLGAREPQPLRPGQIIFFDPNGEEAAGGWYQVLEFDHEQTRAFPEDGWWWDCRRLCDGMIQTICETSEYLHTDYEGAPSPEMRSGPSYSAGLCNNGTAPYIDLRLLARFKKGY